MNIETKRGIRSPNFEVHKKERSCERMIRCLGSLVHPAHCCLGNVNFVPPSPAIRPHCKSNSERRKFHSFGRVCVYKTLNLSAWSNSQPPTILRIVEARSESTSRTIAPSSIIPCQAEQSPARMAKSDKCGVSWIETDFAIQFGTDGLHGATAGRSPQPRSNEGDESS